RPNKKLLDYYLSPFKVTCITLNKLAYKLKLPLVFKIYLIFYMFLLELYYYRASVTLELPSLDVIKRQEEFKVELILVYKE
ncbi:hypothetical protein M430DRAFT_111401, partial [Amorphotheca resinae ATCC 22711]